MLRELASVSVKRSWRWIQRGQFLRNKSERNMIGSRIFHDSVRRTGLSVVVIAAGIVWSLCQPYKASAQGGFDGPGHYEIANLKSGKVLDMDRNDQTSVIQFSSRGTDNQIWEIQPSGDQGFYYLRNAMNGNVLEAEGTRNSTRVRAAPFDGGANQQWRFDTGKDGNALIISRLGKTLDIPGGTSQDGAPVQVYDIDGDSNQRFIFRRVHGGRHSDGRGDGFGGDRRLTSGTITCASDSGQRVYCEADTRGGVRLVRQLSDSPCQEGSTWGYDARGIWADRGCRAEFDISGGGVGQPEHASGTIAADPNPCRIERGSSLCTSYITWSTRGVTQAKVYVTNNSQRGMLEQEFGTSLACESSRCRAPWIARGKTFEFTLYDFSSGRRGQVLGSVTVTAKDGRRR
jgi:hypothetical protein